MTAAPLLLEPSTAPVLKTQSVPSWHDVLTSAHVIPTHSTVFDDVPLAGYLVGPSFLSPMADASSRLMFWAYLASHDQLVSRAHVSAETARNAETTAVTVSVTDRTAASQAIETPTQASAPPESTSELVLSLHARSGLTWEQLAKALNVSKRSLHLWSAGAKVSSKNLSLLLDLRQLVDSLNEPAPDQARLRLLTPQPGAPSVLAMWSMQQDQAKEAINAPSLTPAQLMG